MTGDGVCAIVPEAAATVVWFVVGAGSEPETNRAASNPSAPPIATMATPSARGRSTRADSRTGSRHCRFFLGRGARGFVVGKSIALAVECTTGGVVQAAITVSRSLANAPAL